MGRKYFYSHAGRVVGPLSSSQLRDHATAGKLSPTDVVWRSGEFKKVPASEVKGLYALAASYHAEENAEKPEWFFSRDGANYGPYTHSQLGEFAIEGRIVPSDLVWKQGMKEWVEAGTLDLLFADPP